MKKTVLFMALLCVFSSAFSMGKKKRTPFTGEQHTTLEQSAEPKENACKKAVKSIGRFCAHENTKDFVYTVGGVAAGVVSIYVSFHYPAEDGRFYPLY